MRRVIPFILVVLALAIPFTPKHSLAEEIIQISISNAFLTGNQFLALSINEQSTYAMGLCDGIMLAPIFKAPKSDMYWLESCLEGMSGVQVASILKNHLEKNPAVWHHSVHIRMFNAMNEACPRSPKNKK